MHTIHQPKEEGALSSRPYVHESSHIVHSEAGEWTSIGPGNKLLYSSLGDYSYTMEDVTINYSEIGKFCSIASHACINPVPHPMERASQHHMTYRKRDYEFGEDDAAFFEWRKTNNVKIGHDVWIGHGAIIMKGVTIGTGAVVGSGSVVTKDVPPYTIAAGVPAKPIKRRFNERISARLLEIAWWDWPREMLKERLQELNDVETFIKNS